MIAGGETANAERRSLETGQGSESWYIFSAGGTCGVLRRPQEPGDCNEGPKGVLVSWRWESDEGRYVAKWDKDQWPENDEDYVLAIGSGATKSFSFNAKATVGSGGKYYNEVDIEYSDVSIATTMWSRMAEPAGTPRFGQCPCTT